MSKLTLAAGFAALLAAGAFGVFASAPARAESVMKECGAEWKTAKANSTTNGQTWPEFLKDCKGRHAGTTSAAAPAPAAPPEPAAQPAPSPAPTVAAAPKPARTRVAKVEPASTGAGEFTTEAEAKGHCPSDTVVWVNTKSHKYHYAGHRSYGTTKQGAYMCEADAKAGGDIAAKGEKVKS
jgi:hypothetical protein